MKKRLIPVALVAAISIPVFTSCIGSFALTNKLLSWNRSIGSKIVNELVFIGFWILPVYEVSALADVLVINSIEFWSCLLYTARILWHQAKKSLTVRTAAISWNVTAKATPSLLRTTDPKCVLISTWHNRHGQ